MSDQTTEPLAENRTPGEAAELPSALSGAGTALRDNILSVEAVLNSARLREVVAKVCTRADLEADLLSVLEELASLVDMDGNVRTDGEGSLADAAGPRAQELSDRAQALRDEMATATYSVRFRALSGDEWEAFEKSNRGPDGKPKVLRSYNNKLIEATAVEPRLTVAEVEKLRGILSGRQMIELENAAYAVCTEGGLDVPKLPRFSLVQKPEEQ